MDHAALGGSSPEEAVGWLTGPRSRPVKATVPSASVATAATRCTSTSAGDCCVPSIAFGRVECEQDAMNPLAAFERVADIREGRVRYQLQG